MDLDIVLPHSSHLSLFFYLLIYTAEHAVLTPPCVYTHRSLISDTVTATTGEDGGGAGDGSLCICCRIVSMNEAFVLQGVAVCAHVVRRCTWM